MNKLIQKARNIYIYSDKAYKDFGMEGGSCIDFLLSVLGEEVQACNSRLVPRDYIG